MLIVKSDADNYVEKILERIEQIPKITELVEITYKLENLQKFIITGIPKSTIPDNVLQYIKQQNNDENIIIVKLMQKPKYNTYQLITQACEIEVFEKYKRSFR